MRPLTLHSSALTDSEYDLYTSALLDLAGEDTVSHPSDDSYYASLVVSAREARAWIRGRYTASAGSLSPGQVDAVLKLFCPKLAPADTLSGGQFFAAMRLVTHLRHGKPLDGSLVFVQAHPDAINSPPITNNSPPLPPKSTTLLPKATITDSPSHSRKTSRETLNVDSPTPSASSSKLPAPVVPPKPPTLPTTPTSSTNPFVNRARSHDPSPSMKTRVGMQADTQPVIPPLPPRKSLTIERERERPPPPPPRHSSMSISLSSPSLQANSATLTPGPSSPFAFWHNVSTPGGTPTHPNALMQQSLQAGRIAQSLKKAEAKLEKERVMEVLKSSSGKEKDRERDRAEREKRTRSESPTKGIANLSLTTRSQSVSSGSSTGGSSAPRKGPALPPRRRVSPPLSAASTTWSGVSGRSARSNGSFMEVANASVSRPRSLSSDRKCSPPPQHPDLIPQPQSQQPMPELTPTAGPPVAPPTHPDRKPPLSATSSVFLDGPEQDREVLPRVVRSKSMHSPTTSSGPPIPPRPKRRPESVQFSSYNSISSTTIARDPWERDRDTPRAASPTPTSRSAGSALSSPASIPTRGSTAGISRHASLSARPNRAGSLSGRSEPMGLREPMVGLRDKLISLQPRIEHARYKAEAGLSRRGYVRWGEREREDADNRLVDEDDEASAVSLEEEDGGFGQDGEEVYRVRGGSEGGVGRRRWEERDELKWPVEPGEGWTKL